MNSQLCVTLTDLRARLELLVSVAPTGAAADECDDEEEAEANDESEGS